MPSRFPAGTAAVALVAAAPALAQQNFNRIASFPTMLNMADGEGTARPTSPEIVDATADGMTLVYTDSPLGALGFVDITDPAAPKPLGNLALEGEPTSVKVIGQPDSVAAAPDGSFLVVAIENERDEDLNDGEIPQMPAGHVAIIPLADGAPDCGAIIRADVTGLAEVAPSDPEPQFVDVNGENEIVVTMQENNHIAVLSADGRVLSHFSAGAVDLEGIDTKEEGALSFTDSQPGRKREPDKVV